MPTTPAGRYLGGIRTLDDLMQRCYVSERTGCWHWRLCIDEGGPQVSMVIAGRRIKARGRRAARLLAGLPVTRRTVPAGGCTAHDCCYPQHTAAA